MAKAVMVVWSSPVSPEREAEFNEWYDTVHARDVLDNVEGVSACTRYKVAQAQFGEQELPGSYVAYYDVDTDDLSQIPVRFGEAFVAGKLPMSDVIVPGPIVLLDEVSRLS
jgi:hypothetical protein